MVGLARHSTLAPPRRPRAGSSSRQLSRLVASAGLLVAVAGEAAKQLATRPLAYFSIPVVASLVGYGTNWVGVKMIFYPIKFLGLNIYRWEEQPLGFIGWQGIVPTKARKMGSRLTDVVTKKLLSLKEAFSRLDPAEVARLLTPSVLEAMKSDSATIAYRPLMRGALSDNVMQASLTQVVRRLQRDIEQVLDLPEVVKSAFVRDKLLLVELFQKVGRKELEFLVNSGLSFGFFLGIFQMLLWVLWPNGWVLPVGGALVGYITNWVAIKLIFEPVEPVQVGPLVLQGLFEKRQREVSEEFAEFLASRVLTSPRLIREMCSGTYRVAFRKSVREAVPLMPESILDAAIGALARTPDQPDHPVHQYIDKQLGLQGTLSDRLKKLPPAEFEDLLHPVFQEDELTLIIAGGVLGFLAGLAQQAGSFGGPQGPGAFAVAVAARRVPKVATAMAAGGTAATAAACLLPVSLLHPLGCRLASTWRRWRRRRWQRRRLDPRQ